METGGALLTAALFSLLLWWRFSGNKRREFRSTNNRSESWVPQSGVVLVDSEKKSSGLWNTLQRWWEDSGDEEEADQIRGTKKTKNRSDYRRPPSSRDNRRGGPGDRTRDGFARPCAVPMRTSHQYGQTGTSRTFNDTTMYNNRSRFSAADGPVLPPYDTRHVEVAPGMQVEWPYWRADGRTTIGRLHYQENSFQNLQSTLIPCGQRLVEPGNFVIMRDPRVIKLDRTRQRRVVGLDCEMVGVGTEGKKHALARVSVVDEKGLVVYDSFVRPHAPVTDYRTFVSGIEEKHLKNAPSFHRVRLQVQKIISKCLLVGHGLDNDLKILRLDHPAHFIRDTAYYWPLRHRVGLDRCPPLKVLVKELLGQNIQIGAHNPVEDARAPILLYLKYRDEWDWAVCEEAWNAQ